MTVDLYLDGIAMQGSIEIGRADEDILLAAFDDDKSHSGTGDIEGPGKQTGGSVCIFMFVLFVPVSSFYSSFFCNLRQFNGLCRNSVMNLMIKSLKRASSSNKKRGVMGRT